MFRSLLPLACAALLACGGPPAALPSALVSTCPDAEVTLQVLGSGDGSGAGARSAPAYLVRVAGKARILIDAGPGTLLRFHEAGGHLEDLRAVLLTQIELEHAADLPPLLAAAAQAGRRHPLALVGPGVGLTSMPFSRWLEQLAARDRGLYPRLNALHEGAGDPFRVAINDVDIDAGAPRVVYADDAVEALAIGVPHDGAPSAAYLVRAEGRAIVFAADQRADTQRFAAMAHDADVLVVHAAITEEPSKELARRFAGPDRLAELARASRAGRLVLGHLTPATASRIGAITEAMGQIYAGPISLARDLDCLVVPARPGAAPPAAPEPTPPAEPAAPQSNRAAA
ncbi:MAG: hypothetical protein KC620_15280, partial [Myxococcales bacterium]|nr:hypothetical protein [Myxococcales bacterium]